MLLFQLILLTTIDLETVGNAFDREMNTTNETSKHLDNPETLDTPASEAFQQIQQILYSTEVSMIKDTQRHITKNTLGGL